MRSDAMLAGIACALLAAVSGGAGQMPVIIPANQLIEYGVAGDVWQSVDPVFLLGGDAAPKEMREDCLLQQPYGLGLGLYFPPGGGERNLLLRLSGNPRDPRAFPCRIKWTELVSGWQVKAEFQSGGGQTPILLAHAGGTWSVTGLRVTGSVSYHAASRYPDAIAMVYELTVADPGAPAAARSKPAAAKTATARKPAAQPGKEKPVARAAAADKTSRPPAAVKPAEEPPKEVKRLKFQLNLKVQRVTSMGAGDDGGVNAAIVKGVAYFRKNTLSGMADRVKGDTYRHGLGALVCLALLESGVRTDDPDIDAMLKLTLQRAGEALPTYDAGTCLMLLESACRNAPYGKTNPDRNYVNAAQQMARRLQAGSGYMWTYGGRVESGGDFSNTQYAILGLRAAMQLGVKIDGDFWAEMIKGWLKARIEVKNKVPLDAGRSGGYIIDYANYPGYEDSPYMAAWPYREGGAASVNMTLGMLSNFAVATEGLKKQPEGAVASAMFDGMAYLQSVLAGTLSRPAGYTFYGIERLGVFYRVDSIGGIEWYPAGARTLIRSQSADGSWNIGHGLDASTAFALLFLKRGTRVPDYSVIDDKFYRPGQK